jgi:hypothetical protein
MVETARCDINKTLDCQYVWRYSQHGRPILNVSNPKAGESIECILYIQSADRTNNIPEIEKYFNKCGSIEVVAKVHRRGALVERAFINAYNRELDVSAHKAASAIRAAAEKEHADHQMQKARTQKPDF